MLKLSGVGSVPGIVPGTEPTPESFLSMLFSSQGREQVVFGPSR